nr:hypothetical protein [Tanacetum cinerariifolium]
AALDHVQSKEPQYIKRYHGMKKKPQNNFEARKNIIFYLKNTEAYKMDFFKGKEYDEIVPIFQAKFDANMRFLFKSREEIEAKDAEIIKGINETPAQKAAKRRKLSEEAKEAEDLRKRLEIVNDKDDDVFVEATQLAQKVPVVDYQIVVIDNKPRYPLSRFTLEQLVNVARLQVEEKNETSLELLRYPLSRFTLEQLVNVARLQVEEKNETSLELLSEDCQSNIDAASLKLKLFKNITAAEEMSKMEQYLTHTYYALWEVIINVDSLVFEPPTVGTVVPLKTEAQKLARKNELKAKSTLLLAIPNEHILKFHSIKDAKSLWETIKISRFEGNKESKKMHKTILKQQYENFVASRSEGLDKTYDREIKLRLQLSQRCFWSSENNKNISETVTAAHDIPATCSKEQPFASSYADDVVMITMRVKKFMKRIVRNLNFNGKEPVGFDKTKVECYNCHIRGHFARKFRAPRNQGNRSADNEIRVVQDGLGGYDWSYQDEGPTDFALMAYFSDSTISLNFKLEETMKEKDDLKEKLAKFEESSKNLTKRINSQMSVNDKTGLGYDSQLSENEMPKCEIFETASDSSVSEIDEDNNQAKNRYKVGIGYHAVPPPYTGNYMPPRADLSFVGLEDFVFKFKISKARTSVNENELIASNEEIREERKTVRSSVPIIEDWESDSEDECKDKNSTEKEISSSDNSVKSGKGTGQKEVKPVWNNARRMNHQNFSKKTHPHPKRNFVLTAVATKSRQVQVNVAKQNSAASTSTNRPKGSTTTIRPNVNVVNVVEEKKKMLLSRQYAGFGDQRERCSRHMIGNKSFLTEYQEIDAGFIAFGGSPKGDHLGKFNGKADEEFLVRYSPVFAGNQSNGDAGIQIDILVGQASQEKETVHEYIMLPLISSNPPLSLTIQSLDVNAGDQPGDVNAGDIQGNVDEISRTDDVCQRNEIRINSSTHAVNAASTSINTASTSINTASNIIVAGSLNINTDDSNHTNMLTLEATGIFDGAFNNKDLGAEATTNNLDSSTVVGHIPTTRVHKDHPKEQIIRDPNLNTQTRRMINFSKETDMVFRNKLDERGIVIRNKARLVSQGHTQEEGIDYDEVFAPVARIEAIRLFLAYASFKDFIVYQMDMKSAFLYGTIEEEVYVCQPHRFKDHDFPDKVLSEVKTASTLMETSKTLLKDEDGQKVDVDIYRSMIGSLMYLTSSRPDIMFVVCACARHQVSPKVSHLHAVKRIFRYQKGQPKLGLWYPKDYPFDLEAYTASDYVGSSLDMKSTTENYAMLVLVFQTTPQMAMAKVKKVNDQEQIQALVDKTKVIITEDIIRSDLHFDDAEGTVCLHNEEIFECLARMGAKTTAWNEFSSIMASVIICLADNQKFNFSKYIFENMVKSLEGGVKFYMFPRFLQVFLDKQVKGIARHKEMYIVSSHTKKIFANMRRIGAGFSRGRTNDDEIFRVDDVVGEEVVMDSAAPTIDVTEDEITMAQVLATLKSVKPKTMLQAKEQEAARLSRAQPDEEANNSWDNIQAMMDANRLVAERLQGRSFNKIKELFDREKRNVNDFVAMDSEAQKSSAKEAQESSTKRTAKHLESDISKKQKVDENVEPVVDDSKELRKCIKIVPDDGDDVLIEATPISSKSPTIIDYKIHKEGKKNYFKIIRANGNSQVYQTFEKMFKNFNREDLEVLWAIVKDRFKKEKPVDDMDNILFKTLKIMFEHHVKDTI